ncbi:unnamed protein product [Linum trigynum]|uniref:Uncharacterized protein n=1 Tax=Linum trigynum TaxID=586398 RepID=A0AAV2DVY3_9ROSI
MDKTTKVGGQLGFAKVCVDLSTECGFPSKVRLYPDDDLFFDVAVEYLNLPRVCSHCQVYGHDCSILANSNKKWVIKGATKSSDPISIDAEHGIDKVVQDASVEDVVVQTEVDNGTVEVSLMPTNLISKGKEVDFSGQEAPTTTPIGSTTASFVDVVLGSSV